MKVSPAIHTDVNILSLNLEISMKVSEINRILYLRCLFIMILIIWHIVDSDGDDVESSLARLKERLQVENERLQLENAEEELDSEANQGGILSAVSN